MQVIFTARSILFFQSYKDPLSRILMKTSLSDFKDQSLVEALERFLSVPLQLFRGCRCLWIVAGGYREPFLYSGGF